MQRSYGKELTPGEGQETGRRGGLQTSRAGGRSSNGVRLFLPNAAALTYATSRSFVLQGRVLST
jgi:hypothetical protein